MIKQQYLILVHFSKHIYAISIPRLSMQPEVKKMIFRIQNTHWLSRNCVQLSVLTLFPDRTAWLP